MAPSPAHFPLRSLHRAASQASCKPERQYYPSLISNPNRMLHAAPCTFLKVVKIPIKGAAGFLQHRFMELHPIELMAGLRPPEASRVFTIKEPQPETVQFVTGVQLRLSDGISE
ncbi:Hypothetical predicted protein [Scomber scombrus]|uniref:Uncharacterized protein n=1 Tax=Scomber scombrus TaxID=13677 RepID=A0AAV1PSW1_SCOSC